MFGISKYDILLHRSQLIFGTTNTLLDDIRKEGLMEVPASLKKELRAAESQKAAAVKKFSESHDEEAVASILSEAFDRASTVLCEALRLYLLGSFQNVRKVRKSFKGDEDLAAQHIPSYNEHTKNFLKIEELLGNWTLRGKELDRGKVDFLRKQLKEFLKDFKTGEKALSVARNKAEKAKWMSRITAFAAIVGAILGVKSCT